MRNLFLCALRVSVYIFRIAKRENVFQKRSFFRTSLIKKKERSTRMSLLYRSKNFIDRIIDSISDKVHDYHLKKEYKKLEEEKYKMFYVCNVSNIQTSDRVFLSDFDSAQIIWRGSNRFYKRFSLDDYISEFDRISSEFYSLLTSGNFWLVNDVDVEVIEELCADFDYRCYHFKNREDYENFVAEMNVAIKKELPRIGKNSSKTVFDFFEQKLNEKYRKDGFKYFRA